MYFLVDDRKKNRIHNDKYLLCDNHCIVNPHHNPTGWAITLPITQMRKLSLNKLFALNNIASEMVGQDLKPGLKSKFTCFQCTMLPP